MNIAIIDAGGHSKVIIKDFGNNLKIVGNLKKINIT